MAKELPYFRFTVQEWQNGDITLEDYSLQGLFINICGFYWIKNCSIDIAMLEKKFRNDKDMIHQLINNHIIKLDDNDQICISFLDEQFDLLSESRLKRQLAGKKGGKAKSSNARAFLQQKGSYKDKDKDNKRDLDKNEKVQLPYDDPNTSKPEKEKPIDDERIRKATKIISDFFNIIEGKQTKQYMDIGRFVTFLSKQGRLDWLGEQFTAYVKFKEIRGHKHNWMTFVGNIENNYDDGAWNVENWIEKLKELKQVKKPDAEPVYQRPKVKEG